MDATGYITLQVAARKCGLGLSSVRRAVAIGKVPAYKPAECRRVLVRWADVQAWIEAQPLEVTAPTWSPSVRNQPTCYIFKRKRRRGKNAEAIESRTWYAEIGLPGQPPKRIGLGITDKHLAKRKADEILKGLEARSIGSADLGSDARELSRPLLEPMDAENQAKGADRERGHLAEYVESVAMGCKPTSEWPYVVETCLRKLIRECGWKTLRDISTESYARWQRNKAKAAASGTVDRYGDLLKAWMQWLREFREISIRPIRIKDDGRGIVKRERRAMPPALQRKLLEVVAEHAPQFYVHYHLVLVYELRRGDIERLANGDVYATCGGAWWQQPGEMDVVMHLHASETKAGDDRVYQLRRDTQRLLAARGGWGIAGGEKGLVFPEGAPAVELLKSHLALAEIPFEDGRGRRIDFHALRHTSITHSGTLPGVSTRERQMLAGHKHASTTERYTHEELIATRGLIDAMPRHEDLDARVLAAVGGGTAAGVPGGAVEGTGGADDGGCDERLEGTPSPGEPPGKQSGPVKTTGPRTGVLGFEHPPVCGQNATETEGGGGSGTGLARRLAAWLEQRPVPLSDELIDRIWDEAVPRMAPRKAP